MVSSNGLNSLVMIDRSLGKVVLSLRRRSFPPLSDEEHDLARSRRFALCSRMRSLMQDAETDMYVRLICPPVDSYIDAVHAAPFDC